MIGSHDTFTYLNPICGLVKPFSRLWRTQCKTIYEQYAFGVRFFDIRVARHKRHWAFAHGLATFPILFPSIQDICNYMKREYPLAVYRIVLERGSRKDEQLFISEINNLKMYGSNLWLADIKKNRIWRGQIFNQSELLYHNGFLFTRNSCTWTEPCQELHGEVNIKNFLYADLKVEAMKINAKLALGNLTRVQEMLEDPTRLYFLDYCTNEYD